MFTATDQHLFVKSATLGTRENATYRDQTGYDDGQAISRAAKVLVDDWMHAGRNQAIVSMISVMELLVAPSRAGYDDSPYREFLNFYPHLTLHEVTFEIARTATQLRANTNARTPDSLVDDLCRERAGSQ